MSMFDLKHLAIFMSILFMAPVTFANKQDEPPVQVEQVPSVETTSQLLVPAPTMQNDLKSQEEEATQQLAEIDSLIRSSQYGEALNKAKNLLDKVRSLNGVNPKLRIHQKISVRGVLKVGDAQKPFFALSLKQKDIIMKAILEHNGGLYPDLLNLEKRTLLFYYRAFYEVNKKKENFYERDRKQLIKSVLNAHNLTIQVMDEEIGYQPLLIFDRTVMQDEHSYFFNKEIMDFTISLVSDLGLQAEQFEKKLVEDRIKKFADHLEALKK